MSTEGAQTSAGAGRRNLPLLYYGNLVLIMGLVTIVGTHGFGREAYGLILPDMLRGLGLDYTQSGSLATANFVGYLAVALASGVLASRYGPRVVIFVSMMVVAFSMALTGLAPNLAVAWIGRLGTGAGSVGAFVPMAGLAAAWFPAEVRGFANAVVNTGEGVGAVIAGWLVPWIIASYAPEGWRWAWYFLATEVFAAGVLDLLLIRNRPGTGSPGRLGSSMPLKWGNVFRLRSLWTLAVVYLGSGGSYATFITFLAAYLREQGGLDAASAGHLWTLMGVLGLASAFIWGMISDRIARKWALAAVLAIQGADMVFVATGHSYEVYLAAIVIYGLIILAVPTIVGAVCADYVGARMTPTALGLITVFAGLGMSLGPTLGGYLRELTGSFTATFLMCASLSIMGTLAAASLRSPVKATSMNA